MPRESTAAVAGKMLRVINLVSDLARSGGEQRVGIAEFARLLGMKMDEVERLIRKINLGCGEVLPELFIDYDEDTGTLEPHEMGFALERPLRLTASEARGLLTALESSGIDRADAVFTKIEGAFPPVERTQFDAIRTAAARNGLGELLATITRAIGTRTPLAVAYRGLADDTAVQRTVEPYDLGYDAREQAWYLTAFCRSAGGWRTFRADRIEACEPLEDERFSQVGEVEPPRGLAPIDDAPMAVLAVRDPRAVSDARAWRGLVRVDCPLPQDARKVADTPGAYIAAIPWSQDSPWLPQAIAQALGGVEALRPYELRSHVAAAARDLLECMDVDIL